MKKVSSGLVLFILLSFAQCYAHHIALVVSKDSNVAGLTTANLTKLFKAETRKWPDGRNVVWVVPQSGAQMVVLERLNKMTESELRAFIASHKDSFLQAVSDADVLRLVQTVPGAIGLVDVRAINDKVKVVKVDGKLPLEDGYLPH
jgi:ABC-type phosphate transport system substrate-binding protein